MLFLFHTHPTVSGAEISHYELNHERVFALAPSYINRKI
nr:MAG TPA: hypothetical protein [Caudoviricetes sp.]